MDTYGNLCTQYYDLDKPEAPADAFAFYGKYLQAAKGPSLEIMCGSGRFLIPFVQQGYPLEGVDASEHMLGACKRRCGDLGLSPTLYRQRVEDLALPDRYDLAIIPAGSFGLLTDDAAVAASLERFASHLLPGGTLVLEVETPRAIETHRRGVWYSRWLKPSKTSIFVLGVLIEYDKKSQIARHLCKYELYENGVLRQTEIEDIGIRYYDRQAFGEHLEAAGFTNIRAMGAYDGRDPETDGTLLVFECQKP